MQYHSFIQNDKIIDSIRLYSFLILWTKESCSLTSSCTRMCLCVCVILKCALWTLWLMYVLDIFCRPTHSIKKIISVVASSLQGLFFFTQPTLIWAEKVAGERAGSVSKCAYCGYTQSFQSYQTSPRPACCCVVSTVAKAGVVRVVNCRMLSKQACEPWVAFHFLRTGQKDVGPFLLLSPFYLRWFFPGVFKLCRGDKSRD